MNVEIANYNKIEYQKAGKFEEARYEKIHNVIFKSSVEASTVVAQEIASLIREVQHTETSMIMSKII